MKWTAEELEVLEGLMEFVEAEGEEVCDRCPFAEECSRGEWFWGCGVWEAYMGEDL